MLPFLIGLGTALVATGLIIPVLGRMQAIDVPNYRSSHAVPVPRGAGVAVILAVFVAALSTGASEAWPLIVASCVLGCVGFVDDLSSIGGPIRLLAQVVTAVSVMAWLWIEYPSLSDWKVLVVCLGVVGIVGYTNAFNFMDGVNGISALNAAVAAGWFAWLGHQSDVDALTVLGLAVAGASLGFLPWNAPVARVFLGDSGSYFLGTLIAGMAAFAWASGAEALLCLAPLCVYYADTGWVLVKRALGGRPLMQPHREHVYQRLVDRGLPHTAAAGLTAIASLVLCGVAWAMPAAGAAAVGAVVLVVYLAAPRALALLKVPA